MLDKEDNPSHVLPDAEIVPDAEERVVEPPLLTVAAVKPVMLELNSYADDDRAARPYVVDPDRSV